MARKTEKEFYKLFGISYIEPELRENYGEIEAAKTSITEINYFNKKIFEGIWIFIQKLPTDATPLKK
ncbi:hypothetical protein [Candidatus Coxiella mudrowiae]|uniref:hypothetical protein n=1 Tax=Candidatus Coxiella mudrowiae TaxID=2054173 RepID=UPI001FD61B14|nr:hypothetical protein [Candidatus Coxiella mudrowiae]